MSISDPIKTKTKQHFNKQWKKFNEMKDLVSTDKEGNISHLLRCTNSKREDWKDKTVFEGGCGSGRNTLSVLQLGAKFVTATDISETATEITEENTSEFHDKRETYTVDLEKLQEKDESYDIAFAVNCLPHIPDYKQALIEMVRITKRDGLIMFNVPPIRNSLVHTVDTKIREYTTKMRPKDLELFAEIMAYITTVPEIRAALKDKIELSDNVLSMYDHYGLPFTQEFSPEYIIADLTHLNCKVLEIDKQISVKAIKL